MPAAFFMIFNCQTPGLEQGVGLVGSLDSVDAVFVTKDYDVIDTRNF